MTDFSLLLPNIFDDNTRADKERMKRMILRLQNLQSFYYYHSEKSFVSVSFHPLSIHPCFVTKQRWAQFCVKDVKGEKRLENLWPKCPPTKPPTSHFVHVEIQRYHLLEGFETRTWKNVQFEGRSAKPQPYRGSNKWGDSKTSLHGRSP